MSGAGIPVYASRGKGGGIRLLPDFVLNKSLLTGAEQDEILFALQSLKATSASQNSEVFSRLSGLFRKETVDWIDVDFSRWGTGDAEREIFQMLKTAILERRVIAFTYYNTSGVCSERRVEPMKLRFQSNSWYLQAFCLTRENFRIFKTCRMEGLRLLDETFQRPGKPTGACGRLGSAGGIYRAETAFFRTGGLPCARRVRPKSNYRGGGRLPFGVHLVSRGGLDRRFSAFLWG